MPGYDKTRLKLAAFVVGALSLLLLCPSTLALDPSHDVSQYAHTAWLVRDGFTQGYIRSIAQTPDGYIWLGTGFGLFRFDGVRVEPWQPPLNGEPLPSNFIVCLHVGRDGTFWIGTMTGLASWKDGKLTRYPSLSGLLIASILEDRNGTVWVGSSSLASPGKLCAMDRINGDCRGSGAPLPKGVSFLHEDGHGVLWVVAPDGVWRWRPGPPKYYHMPFATAVVPDLAEASDGTLLIPLPGELAQFGGGKLETQHPYPAQARNVDGTRILRDRDGGVWIGTAGAGVVHLHHGRTDAFSQADGLSGDLVTSLFEDREGDVWVATLSGLDRFRNYAVATYAQHEGFATIPGRGSVVEAKDGSIWTGSNDGLRMWKHGELTIYGTADDHKSQSKTVWFPVHYVGSRGLGDRVSVSVFSDNAGRILVSTPYAFGYMENGRFVSIRGVPGGVVTSVAQDKQGELWIANEGQGLIRLSRNGTVQRISWANIGHRDGAQSLAADRSTGGLWLGFDGGGVAYFSDGQIKETYGRAEGMGNGRVSALHIETDDTVWAATEGGLSRIKNGRVLTLTSKNGLPCDAIHWITQDEKHAFWLNMTCGLVRIVRSELDAWGAESQQKIQPLVFDSSDGVSNAPIGMQVGSQAIWPSDGKMWFQGYLGGVSVIDPQHLPSNQIPPPVDIERITANGNIYEASNGIRLPPQIRDLKIDYAALSFVAPEKVQFRYQLEGQSRNKWEVTTDREVRYSNLAPGNYVFRLIACNNSGVWNDTGASLHFSIAAAYYQTTWFRLCCVTALLLLLWGAYLFRVRQLEAQFTAGMEARVEERTRMARDLHDTLLQSFSALLPHLQTVSNVLPSQPDEAKRRVDRAIEQATNAVIEGRDTVHALRSSGSAATDLDLAISNFAKEFLSGAASEPVPEIHVQIEGPPVPLNPIIRDEVYRIATEAVRNAIRHANARRIEVEIRYDEQHLRLRIGDNGTGIDPAILNRDHKAGHWGLRGMRERAKLVGGTLEVWSQPNVGTEIELSIPAASVYAKPPSVRWSILSSFRRS
ncbi:sensor histidine kinase [Acidicapsa acidisoli]|uniref:sensor histidine kinase n=1 Tax=Acidicapsa acidisoli TaxID=1615681 RepID=UPI0021E0DD45|nr:sensor histidine kinase [Acidicapsa acidisoli]